MAILIPSGPLSEEAQAKVTERQRIVRRWLRKVTGSHGFSYLCGMERQAGDPGGIVRTWTAQFWRASVSYDGKILSFDSCWKIIEDAMNYPPMALLPHVDANLTTWVPVGTGAVSAETRFYTVEYVNGAARPVLIDTDDLPAFDTSALDLYDMAQWLNWSGGKPRHHTHPVPLAFEFGTNMYSVVRGRSKAIAFDITGGARAYSIEEILPRDWVTITGGLGSYTLNLAPGAHVPIQMYPVGIRVTDALGGTVTIAIDVDVVTGTEE